MATGTIHGGFVDITEQFTWDSTVAKKQALQMGNLILVRFQATRTNSRDAWTFATIPSSIHLSDARWTGVMATYANGTRIVRTIGAVPNLTIGAEANQFSTNEGWVQGQIEFVTEAPGID